MRTDPRQLNGQAFDVVVIGAGIQGAALAREAAVRGLSTLLLDTRDIAAGTSSRSSRLVHGGLRYLRNGHFALVKEALHERERLLRLAPHLVRALPMLMPFYPDSGVSRWQMRLGTWMYSRLAGRSTLPRPRSMSAKAAAQAFPGLRTTGLKSALEFYDARTQDARLTLANVVAAVEAGCTLVNHAEVVAVHDRGVQVLDRVSGVEVAIRGKAILNAAGPAVDTVRRRCGIEAENLVRLSRGSHVVLPPRAGELALAAFLPDERIQFVIPHDGGTLCGTTDVDDELTGDESPPPIADLDYLREALGYVLEKKPEPNDVKFAYAGWRALPRSKGPPGSLNREAFIVSEQLPCGHLHTVVGGKLTTHRSFAERAIAKVFGIAGPSPTRTTHLPGGDGPREVDDPLWWRHGSCVRQIRSLVVDDKQLAEQLCPHRPFLIGELVYALRNLAAVTFADVMLRRLVHVLGPCLADGCLRRAHSWFIRERQWPVDDDCDVAIAAVRDEVRAVSGDLHAWRNASPSGAHEQETT
ncbi:MAG: glycerol-3-phosphate dehydrogenase [Planctomycetota bacterium]